MWNASIAVAAVLLLTTIGYISIRWRRAPQAHPAMLGVAASCFLAGALAGVWLVHVYPPQPTALAEQPKPPKATNQAFGAEATSIPLSAGLEPKVNPALVASETPPHDFSESIPPNGYGCGSLRWRVKTLSDDDAARVNLTPVETTVSDLRARPRPSDWSKADHNRIAPEELQVFVVRALVLMLRHEHDGDIHVIIAEPNDPSKTMIAEAVDWRCWGSLDSTARAQYRQVRHELLDLFGEVGAPQMTIDGHYHTTGEYFYQGPNVTLPPQLIKYATVEITGVGFFDDEPHADGSADSAIELHPVLDVRRADGGL